MQTSLYRLESRGPATKKDLFHLKVLAVERKSPGQSCAIPRYRDALWLKRNDLDRADLARNPLRLRSADVEEGQFGFHRLRLSGLEAEISAPLLFENRDPLA